MLRILIPILLFGSSLAFANEDDDQKTCFAALRKFQAEAWCISAERNDCIASHGAEWCDASVETLHEHKYVDQQLNELYKKLMKKVTDRQRTSIRESQRAWLQYRNLECAARDEMIIGGVPVMRNNISTGCIIEFNKSRIKELEREYCSSVGGC